MRVRPSVSSPSSSSLDYWCPQHTCVKILSFSPIRYGVGISSSAISDSSSSSFSSVSSGIVASALPYYLLSFLYSSLSLSRFFSSSSSLSLLSFPISHLPIYSLSFTTWMTTSMPASRTAHRFTLPHASFACAPPAQRANLAKRRRHTSPIPTGLTLGHLYRTTSCAAIVAR